MRYFTKENNLKFIKEPTAFDKHTLKETLQYALGANLYIPATKDDTFKKIILKKSMDVGSITLCLEDAIPKEEVSLAEQNVINFLAQVYDYREECYDNLPLIFIRVRNMEEFERLSKLITPQQLQILCGFVFPKFNSQNGNGYFSIFGTLANITNEPLYCMPILEDSRVMNKETRMDELLAIRQILDKHRDDVLNIRVGGTDFSSIFGLRRGFHTTIYDIHVVADCLTDIVNVFARQDNGYVISGPVWEYYSWKENSPEIRGLVKETLLDIENGFMGKTVIHPSQVNSVNKSYVVRQDEYNDAVNILHSTGGVFAGYNGNRMNETNPHYNWARKIMARSDIFGVMEKSAWL